MFKCYNLNMDNPVGSLEVPINLRARKRLCLSMSERQREILIGCVLGDAYITKLGKIRIEQSIKQREYVAWKYSELKSLCYSAEPIELSHKKGIKFITLYTSHSGSISKRGE